MTNKLLKVGQSAALSKKFTVPGAAVIVRDGAYPTSRIHWSQPSNASNQNDGSEPLVNGRVYLPPDGKFTSFWIVNAIRLVALTGYGMERDTKECLDAGFNVHLTKPINLQRLNDVIQSLAPK